MNETRFRKNSFRPKLDERKSPSSQNWTNEKEDIEKLFQAKTGGRKKKIRKNSLFGPKLNEQIKTYKKKNSFRPKLDERNKIWKNYFRSKLEERKNNTEKFHENWMNGLKDIKVLQAKTGRKKQDIEKLLQVKIGGTKKKKHRKIPLDQNQMNEIKDIEKFLLTKTGRTKEDIEKFLQTKIG